jgi:predicted DNA-binding transcriptional regulator AlpA
MTTKKNKGGRPRKKLTKAQVEEVETLAAVLSVEQIGAYFGLGKTTFYEIMKRQPEVFERYQRGKARAVGSVAKNLIMQAREGNTTAAIFYLKTQAGWKETTRQELTGADGGPIKTEETDGKAELLARLDRIARRIDEE